MTKPVYFSDHVCKTFNSFCKFCNRFISVSVFDSVAYTVLNMALQNDLTRFVEGGFSSIDLRENVFARNVFINHPVDGLDLADDFPETAVEILRINTFVS